MSINTQFFSKEQVDAGEMTEFISLLTKQSYGKGNRYNDIHIKIEDYGAFSVEWVEVPWSHAYGGSFTYVDEGQVVMTEYTFPDNHSELCYDEDDYKERLEEFLKENPGWVKTSYGTWTNEIENEKFKQENNL